MYWLQIAKKRSTLKRKVFFLFIFLYASRIAPADIISKPPKVLPANMVKLQDDIIIKTEKAEELIYKRGALYEDKKVLSYINGIAHKMSSGVELDDTASIEIKIIRDPLVNAFAFPNGSIYVHTGALARLENEAQLAFLLGHEISHVANKDGLYATHSHHNKTIAYKLINIALAPTSIFFGVLGDLAQTGFALLHITTLTGYGRDIEARADREGILSVIKEGYDPHEAANLIEIFLKEKDKYQTGAEIFFLMNHPTNKWRIKKLRSIIAKESKENAGTRISESRFLINMMTIKLYNADLNIKMDRLEHALDNISWVLDRFPGSSEAHYLAGEIARLKANDKEKLKYELNYKVWRELNKKRKKRELENIWREEAISEYKKAIESDKNYANAYKGLGLLYSETDDKEKALFYLDKYLMVNPRAKDRRYVRSLIMRIENSA